MPLPADLLALLPARVALALSRAQSWRMRDGATWRVLLAAPSDELRRMLYRYHSELQALYPALPSLAVLQGYYALATVDGPCSHYSVAAHSLHRSVCTDVGRGVYNCRIWTQHADEPRVYLPPAKLIDMSSSGELILLEHVCNIELYRADGTLVTSWPFGRAACFIGETVVVVHKTGVQSWAPPYTQRTQWPDPPLPDLAITYNGVRTDTHHITKGNDGALHMRDAAGRVEHRREVRDATDVYALYGYDALCHDWHDAFIMDMRTGARTAVDMAPLRGQRSEVAFSTVRGLVARREYPNIYIYVDFKLARVLYDVGTLHAMSWAGRSLVFCLDATAYVITV